MANPLTQAGKGAINKIANPLSKLPKTGLGMFAAGAAWESIASMNEGKGFGESVARGVGFGLLQEVVGGGAMTAIILAKAAPALAGAAFKYNDKLAAQYRSRRDPGNMNFSYTDTQQAFTMRQSAVQAIQGSKMNARSALGGEARLMHRGVPTRWT